MERPDWAGAEFDLNAPSPSRVYDALLGGSHNFKADRDAAEQVLRMQPHAAAYARANRSFLHRAVRHVLDAGVRQYVDIGSGIPTMGSVHEIAQARDPSVRVVYVDVDPVAVAHSSALLAANPHAAVVRVDARDPDSILGSPEVRTLIDFRQPVGMLMVAVLHFIPDADDPAGVVAALTAPLVPGSCLVISHGTFPPRADTSTVQAVDAYRRQVAGLTLRDHTQVTALFNGFSLIRPGLVSPERWRPEPSHDVDGLCTPALAAVGFKSSRTTTVQRSPMDHIAGRSS